jgi:hypothetical protein
MKYFVEMKSKPFTRLAILFLSCITLLHILRIVRGWRISIEGRLVPRFVNAIGAVVTGGLAAMLWKENA